ncbi:lysR substrate binding domain protein [Bacillus pseudomycoides]|nr:lysR substrate binding domain protein [Bacillus pseudomycoides]
MFGECIELGNFDQSQYVLAVREGSYQEVLDWLSSGSADFSISIKENLISGFHYDVIGEDPYVMVSSKSVPSDLTIKELKNYPFIMPLSGCKEVLEPYLTKNEIVVNKVMESETISSALALMFPVNWQGARVPTMPNKNANNRGFDFVEFATSIKGDIS